MWIADFALTGSVGVFLAVVVACLASRSTSAARPMLRTGSIIAATLLLAQAAVVDAVADDYGVHAADRPVLEWFVAHRTQPLTVAAKLLAFLGGTAAMTVLTVLTVLALLLARRFWPAVVVAVAAWGAGMVVTGLKHLYRRHRPPSADQLGVLHSHSLPSGHAMGSTVVLGLVAAAVALGAGRRLVKVVAVAVAAALAVLVGVSRLYLGVHWFTDVLTGWLLGGAWLAVAVTALALLERRRAQPEVSPRTSQTTVPSRS